MSYILRVYLCDKDSMGEKIKSSYKKPMRESKETKIKNEDFNKSSEVESSKEKTKAVEEKTDSNSSKKLSGGDVKFNQKTSPVSIDKKKFIKYSTPEQKAFIEALIEYRKMKKKISEITEELERVHELYFNSKFNTSFDVVSNYIETIYYEEIHSSLLKVFSETVKKAGESYSKYKIAEKKYLDSLI